MHPLEDESNRPQRVTKSSKKKKTKRKLTLLLLLLVYGKIIYFLWENRCFSVSPFDSRLFGHFPPHFSARSFITQRTFAQFACDFNEFL